jgi:hypothetical protein|tara:strand:+ start:850 stop:1080 length:231 start_codon:yes stop_codon:yes gene_type:complete
MIPEEILEAINDLEGALNKEEKWSTFKRLLLISIRPELRSKFSRRDEKTKLLPTLNDFELEILNHYQLKTNKVLQV